MNVGCQSDEHLKSSHEHISACRHKKGNLLGNRFVHRKLPSTEVAFHRGGVAQSQMAKIGW